MADGYTISFYQHAVNWLVDIPGGSTPAEGILLRTITLDVEATEDLHDAAVRAMEGLPEHEAYREYVAIGGPAGEPRYQLRILPAGASPTSLSSWADDVGWHFAVRADGSVYETAELWGSAVVGDLDRATEAGFASQDWHHVLVSPIPPHGGADTYVFDWAQFFADRGFEFFSSAFWAIVGWLLRRLPKRLQAQFARRAARRVTKRWGVNGITDPRVLEAMFDAKDEWTVSSVAHALYISPADAYELLLDTGYMRIAGTQLWVRGASPEAVERHLNWRRSFETPYTEDYTEGPYWHKIGGD